MTIDELRARHRPIDTWGDGVDYCDQCHVVWPCDFVRADDERRRLLAVVEAATEYLDAMDRPLSAVYSRSVARAALRAAIDEVKP